MSAALDVAGVLGSSGRIAQRLKNYESRAEQLQMAEAVAAAIANKTHLVVEAGTGVGKSFAYLVPAILAATANQGKRDSENDEKRLRIVISTHTISLQEQLIERDIPFLNSVLPVEFSAVLVKGRGNYVSLRRQAVATERGGQLYSDEESLQQLQTLRTWSKETTDGSRASLSFKPLPAVWDEVASDSGNCLGKNCSTYNECFYFKARRRAWNADILVVNHALFFSDLAVRQEGGAILPDYNVVVFDEAHTVEAVAGAHLGVTITSGQVEYFLNRLYNVKGDKGLFKAFGHIEGQRLVDHLHFVAQDFFDEVLMYKLQHCKENGRFTSPPKVATELLTGLAGLAESILLLAEPIKDEGQKIELSSAAERCLTLLAGLKTWLSQSLPESVYWLESTGRPNQRQRISLHCAPIEVGPLLRETLFNKVPTAILTSATIAVGAQDFGFLRNRLGLTGAVRELKLGSPFDYQKNARLVLCSKMPDPSADPGDYEAAVCVRIQKYVEQTQGRAFVLFTSYRMLENCAARLSRWFGQHGYSLYSQAAGTPRTLLLDRFRNDPKGVLFGAESFWQGVDVPGDALQNVIIAKLPFSVPDHPLLEARLEAIRSRGGNPFVEYQVPEAVIKLKQGFGRLIRSRTDTGQVVILDPRVRTKPYGKTFLSSLPDCRVVIDD